MLVLLVGLGALLTGCRREPEAESVALPCVSLALADLLGTFCHRNPESGSLLCLEITSIGEQSAEVLLELPEEYQSEWGTIFQTAPDTFVGHFNFGCDGSFVLVLVAADTDTLSWTIRSAEGGAERFEAMEVGEAVFLRQ